MEDIFSEEEIDLMFSDSYIESELLEVENALTNIKIDLSNSSKSICDIFQYKAAYSIHLTIRQNFINRKRLKQGLPTIELIDLARFWGRSDN